MVPRLTLAGQVLVLRALDGETLTFTKLKLGNGETPENYIVLTDLQNPIKTVGLTADDDLGDGYLKLTGEIVRNSDPEVGNGFYWTELGVFAADPDGGSDILYAYAHYQISGDQGPAYIPGVGSSALQITPIVNVFVGEIENVTAVLAEASNYVTEERLAQHTEDTDNPHNVTKEQLGLGNVPNVATNDQEPTFQMAQSLSTLSSGEKLSLSFGKIARAISSFISHFQDMGVHVSFTDRSTWNGKANASHNHSANDINSGSLGTARGGTGLSSIVANRLFYAAGTNAFGQVAQSQYPGQALFQHSSGAPFWSPVCVVGTYTGKGRTGSGSPNSITFTGCRPKLIYIQQNGYARFGLLVIFGGVSQGISFVDGVCSRLIVSQVQNGNDTTVSWYYPSAESHPANQLDHRDQQFVYAAVK